MVVTGLGAVTPIGTGRKELWAGVLAERSAVGPITRFDTDGYRTRIGAEVRDFDPLDYLDARTSRRMDRFAWYTLVAAQQAISDAGLDLENCDPERCGITVGTALAGTAMAEREHAVFMEKGLRRVNPALALTVFAGAASCNVAIELRLQGPNSANGNSCASGTVAIGEAFGHLQAGRADVMLAGGSEAPLAPLSFGAFANIRAMSTQNNEPESACRPFDARRDGFVMGEGSAILLLETLEHANRRDAAIIGEVLGYGLTNDAWHMVAPRPDAGASARAMRLALDQAGISPAEIAYINAHGSSTPLNDASETRAIRAVFGDAADTVPVSGTKGMTGHALGATGAIEAAITLLAMEHDWLPPTVNLTDPDPECDLDYVPLHGREAEIPLALSNSFGFGGINACLVLGRFEAG